MEGESWFLAGHFLLHISHGGGVFQGTLAHRLGVMSIEYFDLEEEKKDFLRNLYRFLRQNIILTSIFWTGWAADGVVRDPSVEKWKIKGQLLWFFVENKLKIFPVKKLNY